MAELTDILADVKKKKDVVDKGIDVIMPILKKEDLDYHVNKIIDQYDDIKRAVELKPYLRGTLEEYVRQTMQEYKWMLYGAKTVDSIDKICSVVELGAGLLGPEAEVAVKGFTEPLEWVLKIPYTAYYATKSKDYSSPLYFLALEAASLIPYIGEAVDMASLYTARVRSQLQKKAAARFLENIVNSNPLALKK